MHELKVCKGRAGLSRGRSERPPHMAGPWRACLSAPLRLGTFLGAQELLHSRGLEPDKHVVEKGELVRQLLTHGGSSAESCSICCESYGHGAGELDAGGGGEAQGAAECAAGGASTAHDPDDPEVLRVLRCGHRFHVECIDKWLVSACDYSRAPACPLCNAPILARAGGPGGGSPQAQQR